MTAPRGIRLFPLLATLVLAGLAGSVGGAAAQGDAASRRAQVRAAPTAAAPAGRAWLGVSYDVRWIQRDSRCEPQVLVERVVQGSPAERAGLRSGDAIVALDGEPVPAARLAAMAGRLNPGDSVSLRVNRDGRVHEVLAVAGRRPAQPPTIILEPTRSRAEASRGPIVRVDGETLVARNIEGSPQEARGYWLATADGRTEYRRLGAWSQDNVDARVVRLLRCAQELEWQPAPQAPMDFRQVQRRADSLRAVIARRLLEHEGGEPPSLWAAAVGPGAGSMAGVELTALVPELAEYFPNARTGVLVLRVDPGSTADRSGLRPGDVIVQVGPRAVASVTELRAALAAAGAGPAAAASSAAGEIRLVRKGRARTVTWPRP